MNIKKIDQAAIILLGLGEEHAGKVMKNFTRREFELVAKAMSKLSGIQADDAKETITEFFDEFRMHSGIQAASKRFLDSILNNALGDNIGKGLVADLYGDEIRVKMQKLQWIPSYQIFSTIRNEHQKIICAFLAYLPPETSSEVISFFSDEEKTDLLFNISLIEGLDQNVADDLIELVELCTEEYTSNKSSSLKGTKQVADILNRFSGDKGELLHRIKERDSIIFSKIQENMFDFYLLLNQPAETIEALHNEIGMDTWAVALKGTDENLKEAVFRVLPNRQMKELMSIMEERGSTPVSVVKKAQQEIINEMKRLAEEGSITVQLYQENVVE